MQRALKRIWHLLCRMDVVSILIATVMLLTMLGSCFPQLPSAAVSNLESRMLWDKGISARYGSLTGLLVDAGVFQFFRTPYFLAALFLLGIATLLCVLNRWRATWRQLFHRGVRSPDSTFDVARQTANLNFPVISDLPDLAREVLNDHGFRVRSEEVGESIYLRADRNWLAPLASLLTHLGVLLLLLGASWSGLFGWRRIIELGSNTTVGLPSEAQLLAQDDAKLRFVAFEIERFVGGYIANYQAQVAISGTDIPPHLLSIRVNHPLKYKQVNLYLKEFQSSEAGERITLLEVYDPGYWLVILSGLLLLGGMTVSFNFPYSCVFARIQSGWCLRLAGKAGKHAVNFDKDFIAVVKDLQLRASRVSEGVDSTA